MKKEKEEPTPELENSLITATASGADGITFESYAKQPDEDASLQQQSVVKVSVGSCWPGNEFPHLIDITGGSIYVSHRTSGFASISSTSLTRADSGFERRFKPGRHSILPGHYYHGLYGSATGGPNGPCNEAVSTVSY